jgi:hypothetical protein
MESQDSRFPRMNEASADRDEGAGELCAAITTLRQVMDDPITSSIETTIQGETNMPLATIIRIVSGVLFLVALGVLVARRKAKNA